MSARGRLIVVDTIAIAGACGDADGVQVALLTLLLVDVAFDVAASHIG